MSWTSSDFLSFDIESTGVDTDTDRIVTASLIKVTPGGRIVWAEEWLADPGVEIPAEATEVHKVTTERARSEGRPAKTVVGEIEAILDRYWTRDVPLVIANAPYDLSLLSAELMRYYHRPVTFSGGVLDPITCDRHLDKYRRGGHTLGALCKTYGVDPGEAHQSASDALAAAQVMRVMARKFPQLAALSIGEVYLAQRQWHEEWAAHLEEYLRGRKIMEDGVTPADVAEITVDRAWPIRALATEVAR